MKIALIGASGNAGSRILQELSYRGHYVTAIARHPDVIPTLKNVDDVRGDIKDPEHMAQILRGHDVVISAIHFTQSDPDELLLAVRNAGVKRYLVVGGAGSLMTPSGVRLLETPEFPPEYLEEAKKGAEFLEILKTEATDLEWTFLSPSAVFVAGDRTGKFRLGRDELLECADGSCISFEDFAVAMADEIEKPKHVKMRFTVGY